MKRVAKRGSVHANSGGSSDLEKATVATPLAVVPMAAAVEECN